MKAGQLQRTLIVDESVVFRSFMRRCLGDVEHIEVIGTASDGKMAMRQIAKLKPDLVTLDMEMPLMHGIDVLKALQLEAPLTKVIVVSSETETSAERTLEALAAGACDFIIKPSSASSDAQGDLSKRLKQCSRVALNVGRVMRGKTAIQGAVQQLPSTAQGLKSGQAKSDQVKSDQVKSNRVKSGQEKPAQVSMPTAFRKPASFRPDIIAIGSSTGGPAALSQVISGLPADLPVPVVITQHMPKLFVQSLASRLDKESQLSCIVATDGMRLKKGHVYLAPGEIHMEVVKQGMEMMVKLVDGPKLHHCKPAVDRMFYSLAALAPLIRTLAVVLTGMGVDGADGAKKIHAASGHVIAQDEASSAVWGMPGATVKAGAAHHVLALNTVAGALCQVTSKGGVAYAAS